MVNALWLTSWYPNKLDAMNGDFIQRHARAAALFCNVNVIHLEADKGNVLTTPVEESTATQGNLTEVIVLYKLFSSIPLIGKFLSQARYVRLFKKYIRQYIQQNGKPAIVHVHVPIKAGLLALWVKRKYGIPYVVTEHWAIYNNEAKDAYLNRGSLFHFYTKKIMQNAALFMPVSNALGKAVQNMVANIPYTVVYNVVDTVMFNFDGKSDVAEKPFTFFHASTLNYQKGPEGILRAFEKFVVTHPQSRLVMAGPASDALVKYASSLNIPHQNIIFTGWLTYAEVAQSMKESNALVMFSRYENMPCIISEALCCGLPVVSTAVGGISEILSNSNGVLLNSGDEEGLLQAMLNMYNNNQRFNRQAIAGEAMQRFSYNTIGKQIVEIYETVLRKS